MPRVPLRPAFVLTFFPLILDIQGFGHSFRIMAMVLAYRRIIIAECDGRREDCDNIQKCLRELAQQLGT